MNKIKIWLKNNYLSLALFLICLITVHSWFKGGLMFGGGEEGLPFYNIEKSLKIYSSVWYDSNGGSEVTAFLARVPFFYLLFYLTRLNLDSTLLQQITFFALIFTGVISIFYLAREIFSGLKSELLNFVSFIAGFFYLFNPYSMSQIWGRGIYSQFFAFALVPLFLLLFWQGLKKNNYIYIIYAILANFIFSSAYVLVTNIIVLWLPVAVCFVYRIWLVRKNKTKLVTSFMYFALILLLWFAANFWWIFPMTVAVKSVFSPAFDSASNLNSLIGISKSYLRPEYVLRLLQGFLFFETKPFNGIYASLPFEAISWLLPLVSIFSLFYIKKIRGMWLIITLWLMGFFVSIGVNSPTGKIFIWFFTKLPFLQAFRNPYEKAGLILMLAYSFLVATGVGFIFTRKKLLGMFMGLGILFCLCFILVFPLWTGGFNNGWLKVPSYYKDANNWLNLQTGDFKIIQLPVISGDGVRYGWKNPYQGVEPSEYIFTRSSIGRNVFLNKPYYNILLQRFGIFSPGIFGPDPDISESEFKSEKFWQELAKLDVRYIVFHNDWDEKFMGMKVKPVAEYLSKQNNIKLIKTFGELDIYLVDIPENIARVYSPDANTKIAEMSSAHYIVHVADADGKTRIYFLDLFDPNWAAFVDGQKVDIHKTVFGYANSWLINRTGDFDIDIRYSPQDSVTFGWKVTGITLLFLLIILVVRLLSKK